MSADYEGRLMSPQSKNAYDRNYPIRVPVGGDLDDELLELCLGRNEAAALVEELERLIELFDKRASGFVQVVFEREGTTSRRYTYSDPSGELEVNDLVIVPTQSNPETEARVVALGRGAYIGPTSSVIAKLVTERVEL